MAHDIQLRDNGTGTHDISLSSAAGTTVVGDKAAAFTFAIAGSFVLSSILSGAAAPAFAYSKAGDPAASTTSVGATAHAACYSKAGTHQLSSIVTGDKAPCFAFSVAGTEEADSPPSLSAAPGDGPTLSVMEDSGNATEIDASVTLSVLQSKRYKTVILDTNTGSSMD